MGPTRQRCRDGDRTRPCRERNLEAAIDEFEGRDFTAIDAGCAQWLGSTNIEWNAKLHPSHSVDGATSMIERAQAIDIEGTYVGADLSMWNPQHPVELVHSMEVLYYLEDIPAFLNHVNQYWLNKDGIFAFGIDHYFENRTAMDGRRKSVSEWRCTAKMNGKIWLKTLDSKSSGCSDQHKLLNGQAHCHLFSRKSLDKDV